MSKTDITVLVGGEAGQGILTIGELLAETGRRAGFYAACVNDFESRIRGGHSFSAIRISDEPVSAPSPDIHLLVALDETSLNIHLEGLDPGGLALVPEKGAAADPRILPVPFEKLAKEAGGRILANSVAAGAALALLGAPPDLLLEELDLRFSSKGQTVADQNRKAARLGRAAAGDTRLSPPILWEKKEAKAPLMTGAKALALGALAADCRFCGFYPMSPATGIVAAFKALEKDMPLVVEQAEDEIGAANMIIGASFAGVRAMTATSGGGFCLMTEALGLAGITETPVVFINAQRPGPSTGLPTRTGQGDLLFCIHASQDEFPRFVFAPGSLNQAYDTMIRAFHLADKYQVPVIVLVDQYFTDSLQMTEGPFTVPETIERFLTEPEPGFRRYAAVDGGVSPRALPDSGPGYVMVSSNEHDEQGHMTEVAETRRLMKKKRWAKAGDMEKEMQRPETYFGAAKTLLAGWGSTRGMIFEAVDRMRARGLDVGAVHFTDIWPFPSGSCKKILGGAERFFVVEQNDTAQLGRLIRMQTGLEFSGAILKSDGRPFFPQEVEDQVARHYHGEAGFKKS